MKNFEKFCASPYHNNGRNFKPLRSLLKKYHPELPAEKFTDEKNDFNKIITTLIEEEKAEQRYSAFLLSVKI